MKLESTKIFAETYQNGARSVFVISGDVDWCVRVLQECEEAFRRNTATPLTVCDMHRTVELTLRAFYEHHVYPHPEPRPNVELFVVLAAHGESVLFRTTETALRRLKGYDCRGTGAYLAHSLLRNRYNTARRAKQLTLPIVFRMTMRALKRAKDYDDGCGLASEVMVLSQDGQQASPVARIKRDTLRKWREAFYLLDTSLNVQV